MITLSEGPVLYQNGKITETDQGQKANQQKTIAYQILKAHNTAPTMDKLQVRFDKLTSHDITYVGIIQTARASGLERFPMPYVLTNCHNSLCAVGGTINEDDHVFGLTCAQKYGGIYVPPHQAVIHQFAREMLAEAGGMILGSDSHTRYGALGCMAVGEGGPELVKQLLDKTYDIDMPEVICIYLTGKPEKGVGPQDVALALIGAVFKNGYVKNKVLEFVGPGVHALSADYRIGIDVMTTETTCLSSIWETDQEIADFYEIHGRKEAYKELKPDEGAYYDGAVMIDLSQIRPMIAMPFHPSNVYTIEEVNANLEDILREVEKGAAISLDNAVPYSLTDKIRNGKLYVEQGVIAGCAGGGFENIMAAADILNGANIGNGEFTLSVYPASMPIYMELVKNGTAAKILETGAVLNLKVNYTLVSTDGSGEEGKYSVFTDASDAEVEAYAQKVVDAVLAKDWDSVGDMISYPIGSKEDNNLCNNKEEFVEYAKNTGFDDSYFKSLSAWKVSDLWGNWQGGCIDDGNIWFSGVNDEGFKILTLFDLRMGDATITD